MCYVFKKLVEMPTYDEACKRFDENGCKFITCRESYEGFTGKEKMKMKVEFIAKCQHHNTVTLVNFWYKKSGLICKDCMYKNVGQKLKAQQYNHECTGLEQEFAGIQLLKSIACSEFDIQKTNEGCLADILIRPKYVSCDKWGLIQIKTTKSISHDLYTFKMKRKVYTDCCIVCISMADELFWVFDHKVLSGQDNLNIGKTTRSEFHRYRFQKDAICEQLHKWYAECKKFNIKVGMKPISVNHQQEQQNRRFREDTIPYLPFIYPEVDGRKTDFYVNNYKVQEKIASIYHDKKSSYIAHICRTTKENKKQHYKQGDNHFYWVWLKNDSTKFYIFPEKDLIERGFFVGLDGKKSICITKGNWTDDYCYHLNDKYLQEKLETLFEVSKV